MEGQSLAYDANDRLTTDTCDNNGNTVTGHLVQSAPTVSDAYDFEDRLINRNSGQVTVVYDGDGNRVAKTVSGVTTLFLVDDRNPTGYAQVLEEIAVVASTAPVLTRVYAYGHDLISQDQLLDNGAGGFAWTLSFYGYDGHGNVRYLTGTNGAVSDTYDYDAFGTLVAHTGTTPNAYLYCGEQFDADLGLYYNRARYLNADSGRFWSRDVFEGIPSDPVSLHKYLYAGANSVNKMDPSGKMTLGEFGQTVKIWGSYALRVYSTLKAVQKAGLAIYYANQFVKCSMRQIEINKQAVELGDVSTASMLSGPCGELAKEALKNGAESVFWVLARALLVKHGYNPFDKQPLGQ